MSESLTYWCEQYARISGSEKVELGRIPSLGQLMTGGRESQNEDRDRSKEGQDRRHQNNNEKAIVKGNTRQRKVGEIN